MNEAKRRQLKVADLIVILQQLPHDMPVFCEGCDCYGECVGASVETTYSGPGVMLERNQ